MKKLLFLITWSVSTYAQSIEITPSGTTTLNSSNTTNYLNITKTGTNTHSGLRFYQNLSAKGGLFYSDQNTSLNIAANQNQAGIVWKLDNLSMGIGTFTPEGKVHVLANSSADFPQILLRENNNADGARINFENFSVNDKRWTLYGMNAVNPSANVFNIYHSDHGNVAQFTGNGNVKLSGFTKLGSDAPSIKMRKITGFLDSHPSYVLNLPSDLEFDKIIDYKIFVVTSDPEEIPGEGEYYELHKYLPHNDNPNGYNYRAILTKNVGTNSIRTRVIFTYIGNKLRLKPYTIVVFYEE